MRPAGIGGRIFGVLMEWLASPNYHWVLRQLAPQDPQSWLEVGFGTGRLAQMATQRLPLARLCGVDPSELMLKTASRRLRTFARRHDLDLRLGDNTLLAVWPDGRFDAVVASHSWQFWSEPAATLSHLRLRLAPQGRLVMVIRRHISKAVFDWLPNPISKSADELGGLRAALAAAGFAVLVDETLSTGSQGIVAAAR